MKNIAIIGASGALGAAFVSYYASLNDVASIHAFSRSTISFDSSKIICSSIELEDEASIKFAAEHASIHAPLDIVVVATGILHNADIVPEKSINALTSEKFAKLFSVNTIGPALVIKHFLPKLNSEQNSVFALLSAKVGSISDNHLGGWYAYRASKAALNMIIKTTSIELARKQKNSTIIGLHPGTVDSPLSKPFQSDKLKKNLFTAQDSVVRMATVLNKVKPIDSGKCFAYDGSEIFP